MDPTKFDQISLNHGAAGNLDDKSLILAVDIYTKTIYRNITWWKIHITDSVEAILKPTAYSREAIKR